MPGMTFDLPPRPVCTSRRMEQQWQRTLGVKTMRAGISPSIIARQFEAWTRAAFESVAASAQSGQNALPAKGDAGRPPEVNAEVFRDFARQLALCTNRRVILVVDGHSIHRAGIVRDCVDSTDGMLELHYLPPYSPQLDPDERVWKNATERVAKHRPTDRSGLRALLNAAFLRLMITRAGISRGRAGTACPMPS
jgi:transposase